MYVDRCVCLEYVFKTSSTRLDHAPRITGHQQVPLEVLHQELQAHLSVLHGDLVEVINKDYEGFLHLTSRLTSVQGAVKRIEGPLAVVKVGSVLGRCLCRGCLLDPTWWHVCGDPPRYTDSPAS